MENEIEKGLYTKEELDEARQHVIDQIKVAPNNSEPLDDFIASLERHKIHGLVTEKLQLDQISELLSDIIVLAKSAHNASLENRVRELEKQYFPEDQKAVA